MDSCECDKEEVKGVCNICKRGSCLEYSNEHKLPNNKLIASDDSIKELIESKREKLQKHLSLKEKAKEGSTNLKAARKKLKGEIENLKKREKKLKVYVLNVLKASNDLDKYNDSFSEETEAPLPLIEEIKEINVEFNISEILLAINEPHLSGPPIDVKDKELIEESKEYKEEEKKIEDHNEFQCNGKPGNEVINSRKEIKPCDIKAESLIKEKISEAEKKYNELRESMKKAETKLERLITTIKEQERIKHELENEIEELTEKNRSVQISYNINNDIKVSINEERMNGDPEDINDNLIQRMKQDDMIILDKYLKELMENIKKAKYELYGCNKELEEAKRLKDNIMKEIENKKTAFELEMEKYKRERKNEIEKEFIDEKDAKYEESKEVIGTLNSVIKKVIDLNAIKSNLENTIQELKGELDKIQIEVDKNKSKEELELTISKQQEIIANQANQINKLHEAIKEIKNKIQVLNKANVATLKDYLLTTKYIFTESLGDNGLIMKTASNVILCIYQKLWNKLSTNCNKMCDTDINNIEMVEEKLVKHVEIINNLKEEIKEESTVKISFNLQNIIDDRVQLQESNRKMLEGTKSSVSNFKNRLSMIKDELNIIKETLKNYKNDIEKTMQKQIDICRDRRSEIIINSRKEEIKKSLLSNHNNKKAKHKNNSKLLIINNRNYITTLSFL